MTKLKTIFFAASALALLGVSACKDPSDGTGGDSSGTLTPKYRIFFSVGRGSGTLKAEVDGVKINSGDQVEKDKTLVFTAEPDAGYVVKQWTKGYDTAITEAGTDKTYTYTVTADATIRVEFKVLPAPLVEGGASLILSRDRLDIKVKVTTADNSSVRIEGCTETELTSGTETVLHATGTVVILKGKIIELSFRYNQLTALNVQGLTALQELNCDSNNLTGLNVQGLTALQRLACYHNWLTALNVQGLTALQSLSCGSNNLTGLNVQGLTSLQELWCSNNKLTALDVQGLTALQRLACYHNRLTALNVQGLTALQELDCYNNQLTALDVQGLTALQSLACDWNQLTALNVQGLTALQILTCDWNQLTALNVQSLTALQRLDCYNNQLTALDVQGCTALQSLPCFGNRLTADAFKKLFNDLSVRADSDNASCYLYTERTGDTEGNHTYFSAPSDLADAFNNAKTVKKWKMYKFDADGQPVGI